MPLLMLNNSLVKEYGFITVNNVFFISLSPLQSTWLGYSVYTRATEFHVPAIETCCHVPMITNT